LHQFLQGIILGFIIVLPGMSGGTVFLIFGMYEQMVKDLVKFNFKPYYMVGLGLLLGIFISGNMFVELFQNYRDFTVSFLLGCLLASIKSILKDCPKLDDKKFLALLGGVTLGFFLIGEPIKVTDTLEYVNPLTLIIGGALSSSAMIIPGIPGSSVLIIMGIYDNVLIYLKEIAIKELLYYGIGSILGIVLLLKLLDKIYEKYKGMVSYFFTGLILMSTRVLLPHEISFIAIVMFLGGFALVWFWSDK